MIARPPRRKSYARFKVFLFRVAPTFLSLSLSLTLSDPHPLYSLWKLAAILVRTAAATDELFSPVNISELSKNILWGKHRWGGGPPVVCICLPWKWNSSKIERNAFQIQPADISIYLSGCDKKIKEYKKKKKKTLWSFRSYKMERDKEKGGEEKGKSWLTIRLFDTFEIRVFHSL